MPCVVGRITKKEHKRVKQDVCREKRKRQYHRIAVPNGDDGWRAWTARRERTPRRNRPLIRQGSEFSISHIDDLADTTACSKDLVGKAVITSSNLFE